MKNNMKITTVLPLIFFMLLTTGSTVLAFGFPKVLDVLTSKSAVDVNSIANKQEDLTKRLYAALTDVNSAQLHFATALGNKKEIETLKQVSASLAKGNIEDKDALKNTIALTSNVSKAQNETFSKMDKLNESQKKEVQKGLLPYATGTAHTVQLSTEFTKHLASTKDAFKASSLADLASLKKKFDVTITVAPKLPVLVKNLATTANTLIKISKKSDLDVSDAVDKLGDL